MAAKKSRGFTLIELLIAMAIFAMAGVAVMRATSEHIRAVSMLEEITIAGYVAENQLQLSRQQKKWPPELKREGEAEMAKRRWKWLEESLPTDDPDFRLLKVSVMPLEEPNRVITVLQTFVGRQDD